jgi:DNA-binding response OmpR family regulator
MSNIVIIDDEPEVRGTLADLLIRAGHDVRVYPDTLSGLTALRAERADLVITDIVMPNGNGVDLIAMLRAEHPDTRVIAMSGGGNFRATNYAPGSLTTQSYLAAAKRMGADIILPKPFERAALLSAVNELCRPA